VNNPSEQVWIPDLIYVDGKFVADTALVCSGGEIVRLCSTSEVSDGFSLKNQALLPGLANGHSHAFQRVIRGRTEYKTHNTDSFWTWREQMYAAANQLSPEDLYVASRMAFLEMALTGITAVGEFHYIHNAPDGSPYSDPNLLAKQVIQAAASVGLRIALLRVAYARAGFQRVANPLQARFIDRSPDSYLKNVELLVSDLKNQDGLAWAGIAPHSIRAVPLEFLKPIVGFGNQQKMPIHMHLAEQPAEVSACIEEYGRTPVALLETEGLLSDRFTAVHAIHVTPKSIPGFAATGALVCACPTTERNLGDGVLPVAGYLQNGMTVSLGTDSQTQIDLLEDARELEYHLRLQRMERNVLAAQDNERSSLARILFECATMNGARSIGCESGKLAPKMPADFFTVDLGDPSIAGANPETLLTNIVFSSSRAAIREVVVAGTQIVSEGRHANHDEIVREFKELQNRLWN
jgi:formimidoylglutamate deiminase